MFGLSKRAITILFGLLALAFALGAILLFTPQAAQQTRGKPVLWVNGKALYELDLLRLQGNDPLYAASPEGLLKTLVDTYFLEQVILTEALKQDAARVRVSSAEVRQEVNRIREQFGLKDKAAYEQFLNQVGYTDAQLRAEVKTQLQIQKRLEQIRSGAKPTEEEVRFYYEVFKENYRTEPRVKARQIVVDDKALAEELAAKAFDKCVLLRAPRAGRLQPHLQPRAADAGVRGADRVLQAGREARAAGDRRGSRKWP